MKHEKICLFIFLFILAWSPVRAQTDSIDLYHKNVLSVVQFQFTENGLGLGTSYERFADKKQTFAFYLPAMVTFNIANSNKIYDYNTGNFKTGKANAMYYAMPGLKIYPFAARHRFRYAVGISFVLGSGYRSVDFANYGGRNITELVLTHKIYGFMLQNSINIFEHKRLYVGGELGGGTTIVNYVGGVKMNNEFLIQGAFKVGYRF